LKHTTITASIALLIMISSCGPTPEQIAAEKQRVADSTATVKERGYPVATPLQMEELAEKSVKDEVAKIMAILRETAKKGEYKVSIPQISPAACEVLTSAGYKVSNGKGTVKWITL
jgi:hypothetical protein